MINRASIGRETGDGTIFVSHHDSDFPAVQAGRWHRFLRGWPGSGSRDLSVNGRNFEDGKWWHAQQGLGANRAVQTQRGDETMKPFLHLIAWVLNRRLYGTHTAQVIWSIDTTMARVERMEGARMPH